MTAGRLGANITASYDDEYYGFRMQKLMQAGADRYLPFGQEELVELAMSPLSDNDMVETFLGAREQDDFNSMRTRFESMAAQEQEAEYAALPPQTQQVLLTTGYEPPQDKEQQSLIKRMVTWDIPLLPEEHFGPVVAAAMAPARVMGFFAGKVVSGAWENLVMKPSRFATHFGRTTNYLLHGQDPSNFGKAWDATQLEDDSYWQGTVNSVINMVGDTQTEMLRLYSRDGIKGVFDYFQIVGQQQKWSTEEIQRRYRDWYSDLSNTDNQQALQVLNDNKLNLYTASIRNFNVASPWDVAPNSLAGKIVGTSGSLITEILLDPTTWMGGAYIKIAKVAKAGVRGNQGRETINLFHKVTKAERIEDPIRRKNEFNLAKSELVIADVTHKSKATINPARMLANSSWYLRSQARAMNKFIDRVNAAFKQMDEMTAYEHTVKDMFHQQWQRTGVGEQYINATDLEKLVIEKFGVKDALGALRRDIPHIDLALEHMKLWHYKQKGRTIKIGDKSAVRKSASGEPLPVDINEARELLDKESFASIIDEVYEMGGEIYGRRVSKDLSTFDGYWEFLANSDEGWKTLGSRLGNMDKDAIYLPRMGKFASQWARTKEWIRKPLDFADFDVEVKADMGRMFATYIAKQTRYVHDKIMEDLAYGTLKLSKDTVDEPELEKLLQLIGTETGDIASDTAKQMGYNQNDLNKLVEQSDIHHADAYQVILDDSELDELLKYHMNEGYEIRVFKENDGKTRRRLVKKRTPFTGAQKAWKGAREDSYRKYIEEGQLVPGSMNDELNMLQEAGVITKQTVAAFMYYPARFAQKLTTYVPKGTHLDLQDADTVVKEFAALAEMGLMSDMSRDQIHHYIRRFVMGNDSERWRVQHDFYLDFLGRSGALLYGGADVQKYVQRFIRHGHQAYANVADDAASLNGLNINRAVHIGPEYGSQIAAGNIMPSYRELGIVSKYMAFYRTLGWGLPLPQIDKFLSRTWRPAVLLRLGYVARNGGEELFSWMLREGPSGWVRQKLAKSSLDMYVTYDQYGRKVRTLGKDLTDADRRSLLISPFSRIWRSFNEIAGWGDNAVTAKAVKQAAEKNPESWRWLSAEAREELFKETREQVAGKINRSLLGGTSRRMFDYAEAVSNKLTLAARDVIGTSNGMPYRKIAAKAVLKKVDRKNHERRLEATMMSLTNPTLLDAHMKEVLGAFDTYLNFDSNVDHALRSANNATDIATALRMPMNHLAAKLDWVNLGNQNLNAIDQSIAVSQRLHYLKDDVGSRRYVVELLHYISDRREVVNAPIAAMILGRDFDFSKEIDKISQLREITNTEIVATWLSQQEKTRIGGLDVAFDNALLAEGEVLDQIWFDELTKFAGDPNEDILRAIFEGTSPQGFGPDDFIAADPNDVAFMLMSISDSPFYDINASRFTRSRDIASNRGREAYVDHLLTPAGQQALRTAHGTNFGFGVTGGAISSPLPNGAVRLSIPMLPIEYKPYLVEMLSGGGGERQDWFNDFVDILESRLRIAGRDPAEATKIARLLHPFSGPHSNSIAPSSLLAGADHWDDLESAYFPITIGSGNSNVAHMISDSLEQVIIKRHGRVLPPEKLERTGHFGFLDVNADEILNKKFANREGRPAGVDIPVIRNGVESTEFAETLSDSGPAGLMNNFYGFGKNGLQTSAEFGKGGLGNEVVIGIAGHHLLDPTKGLKPVQMINGNPDVYNVYMWRNKETNMVSVLREGDERERSWFNTDLYEKLDDEPQLVAGNDLHNAAEMFAFHNKLEIENILFNNVRYEDEIFSPWAREIVHNEEINPLRINTNAQRGDWWDQAPDRVLAHIPVTDQGGSIGENISKAWNSVLRNWFDGVVNPMIGAIVREPLFQHYLMIGFEQTQDVRRIYHRPQRLNQGTGELEPADRRLAKRAKLKENTDSRSPVTGSVFDENNQLVVEEIEHFVKFGWPFSEAAPEEVASKLAKAIEDGSNHDIQTGLRGMINDPETEGNRVWGGLINHLHVSNRDLVQHAKRTYFKWDDESQAYFLKKDIDAGNYSKSYRNKEIDEKLIKDLTDMNWKEVTKTFEAQNASSLRGYMFNRKIQFDKHRDIATRRAMTLTGAYIDDHRIRSQFQQMVGTAIPFWFAEDNFLRRMGRSLKQNPMIFRNLNLTMNAGVNGGMIQEDQHGNQVLVIPGSEMATTYMLEIADRFPIVNRVFGGPLGSIAAPKRLAMNVHVIPGYDIDQVGRMGFGPLLSIPILYASGRDPDIRKNFENHMVGGRYGGMSRLESTQIEGIKDMANILYASAMPAIAKRSIDIIIPAITSFDTAAHAKAKTDIIKFLAVNGQVPDEAEVASQSNPRLFEEEFFAKVDEMARQYLLLQSLTWFMWGTGKLEQMMTHESWEWNSEFHELMQSGIPYEEAYPLWVKNVEAFTGKPFDPWTYTPFSVSTTKKVPFAVLESTQEANRWLADNGEFVQSFKMGSGYFMPRKFDVENDDYVWEAQARQLNLGLREEMDDEEFLEALYSKVSGAVYSPKRVAYLQQKYEMQAAGLDTSRLDAVWDTFSTSFMEQHPSYANTVVTGTAKQKREQTIREFRLFQAAPHLIPDTIHKQDILDVMATILAFDEKFNALSGSNNTQKRDVLRERYYEGMERFVQGKPWLNELYYNVFIPLITESWVGKYRAGLKGGAF